MIRIAVIIGSTRPERFGEIPATWIADRLAARGDLDVAVVDLRDYPLPFFAEAQSPARTGRDYRTPEMARWGRTIDAADGYVIVTPECLRRLRRGPICWPRICSGGHRRSLRRA
jgi:NAD(P)H-dependent FMN reductase